MKTLQKRLSNLGKEYTLDELNRLEELHLHNNPNLVLFEDQVTWIKRLGWWELPEDYKMISTNENTDISFG
jgi:hypothetical protein